MSVIKNIQFVAIAHVKFNNHHKLWGAFVAPCNTDRFNRRKVYTFWGFLNSSLHIKLTEFTTYDAYAMFEIKRSKNYQAISHIELIALWPEFDEKFMESWLEVVLSQ